MGVANNYFYNFKSMENDSQVGCVWLNYYMPINSNKAAVFRGYYISN